MIHKAIEEFYVIVSSEDPLVHFGDNTGGQFRVQFPRTYHERQMGVCVIERFFCTAFETPTRRVYVCGAFLVNYSYVETRTNRFSNPSASCTKN